MENKENSKPIDEIQAELNDPHQKQKPLTDTFKTGDNEQKGIMNTPPDEQQFENESEPPLDQDFTD